ncbi:MAG: V-type ATP synthase subunit I, partial [Christensenellales bacterium]
AVKAYEAADKVKESVIAKKGLFHVEDPVSYDEFTAISSREYELLADIRELEKMNARLGEIRSELQRTAGRLEQLKPYLKLDTPFEKLRDTKYTSVFYGTYPETAAEKFAKVREIEGTDVYELGGGKANVAVIIATNEKAQEVADALNSAEFARANFDYTGTAEENTARLKAEEAALNAEKRTIAFEAVKYVGLERELKILSDYYLLGTEMAEASDGFACTKYSFILEAWVPAGEADGVIRAVSDSGTVFEYYVEDPEEGDDVPTYLENSKLVAPYESITNMYSVPNYKERDPNPFVAVFYFLFFGIMLSDAAYGLIMTVATLVMLKVLKPRGGTYSLLMVLCMGGVSTLIWGVIFGGYMGIEGAPALWFNPLSEPLTFFILSLCLGVLQIMFGIGLKAAALIRNGQVWDAIFDCFSWLFVFTGAIVYILGSMVFNVGALGTAGLAIVILGFAIVLFTAGRRKKNIFGKILGGLNGLYGTINYISDIFSYARLFGLGLATGAIGMVFNKMSLMVFDILSGIPVVGVVIGGVLMVAIFTVGHVFNIAINALGAYVHNNRMQFVEFFSKFYEGEGRA